GARLVHAANPDDREAPLRNRCASCYSDPSRGKRTALNQFSSSTAAALPEEAAPPGRMRLALSHDRRRRLYSCDFAIDLFGCPFGCMISQIPASMLRCWQPISPAALLSPGMSS